MSTETINARVTLACLVEPGNHELYRLLTIHSPQDALARLLSGEDISSNLRAAVQARLAEQEASRLTEIALARTRRIGARLVIPEDDEWPSQVNDLKRISNPIGGRIEKDTFPPICLWVLGDVSVAETLRRSVAVVGARAASSYGNHVATEISHGLARRAWTVVSGGAFGIDAAAHRGAIAAQGVTAAVLAGGLDRPYPAAHANLFDRITDTGLLLSEWPPGADPHRHRFLIRNRLIAAITVGTVMVEAGARSGARQTLGRASRLGRAAMAVPGPVTSAMSVGCHDAIRRGARLVSSCQDVLEEVGTIGDDLAPLVHGPEHARDRLGPELARILDAVPHRPSADPGQIAAQAGVPLRTVLRAMPALEAAGYVTTQEGGYVLARKPSVSG